MGGRQICVFKFVGICAYARIDELKGMQSIKGTQGEDVDRLSSPLKGPGKAVRHSISGVPKLPH